MFSSQRCCQTLMSADETCRFGILTASDRATAGEYEDRSGPAIKQFLEEALTSPWEVSRRLVEDEQEVIEQALIDLCEEGCSVIIMEHHAERCDTRGNRSSLHQRQPKQFVRECFRASVNKCGQFHSSTCQPLFFLDRLLVFVVRL